jgi:hypothetical protein
MNVLSLYLFLSEHSVIADVVRGFFSDISHTCLSMMSHALYYKVCIFFSLLQAGTVEMERMG